MLGFYIPIAPCGFTINLLIFDYWMPNCVFYTMAGVMVGGMVAMMGTAPTFS